MKGIKIIKQNCDLADNDDRTLPSNSYLVEYTLDGKTSYDIVLSSKKVDLFDYYWDLYKSDFVGFKQTEGRINPRLWNDPSVPQKSKKK